MIIEAIILASGVTFSWDANPEPDLNGYKIYYGSNSRNYEQILNVGRVTSFEFAQGTFMEGRKYFAAVTAYDNSNNESGFSSEVSFTILAQTRPAAPIFNIVESMGVGGPTYYPPGDTARFIVTSDTQLVTLQFSLKHNDFKISSADSFAFRYRPVGTTPMFFHDQQSGEITLIQIQANATYEIGAMVYKDGLNGFFSEMRYFRLEYENPATDELFLLLKVQKIED